MNIFKKEKVETQGNPSNGFAPKPAQKKD